MRIPVFWRLILSHLGILLLSGAACLYSIVQLGSLSESARAALDGNHRMIAYEEVLADTFLSEVRYSGKYLITHTESRYDQLRQFKKDFIDYLELLKRLGQSESISPSLSEIERLHAQYHELFDREVEYIRAGQIYAQSRFQQERDKIVERTLNELDLLKAQLRTKLQQKIASIEQGARTARRIAIATTLVVLFLGTLLSMKVSRSIEAPLSEITAAQRQVELTQGATKVTSIKLLERLYGLATRLPALMPGLISVWRRRAAMWKNPSQGKVVKP
jgi:CHASE3 domain sensor protein